MPLPIETNRLLLRLPNEDDAPMVFKLFNQADSLKFIGDRGIHSIADAVNHINNSFLKHYQQHGFCLYTLVEKSSEQAIGVCGLIQRDNLTEVDLGFGILSANQNKGFVSEAISACINHAKQDIKLSTLVAITHPENFPSIKVLTNAGFSFNKKILLSGETKPINLYQLALVKNS